MDRQQTFRALAKACRKEAGGPIDMEEFERLTEVMVNSQWGSA